MDAVAVTPQPRFTTRARFRADLRDVLESAIRLASVDVGSIVNDPDRPDTVPAIDLPAVVAGLSVIPRGPLLEALHAAMSGPLPPPSEREAEIRTNAVLNVWARCPNCGIHLVIPVEVEPQLTIGSGGTGELKVKAKSKGRIHACHQLTLEEPEGQLRAFAPDSMGHEHEDVSDDAPAATPDAVLAALEAVRGSLPQGVPFLDDVERWDQVTLELVADWARGELAGDHGDMPTVLAPTPDEPSTDPAEPTPITKPRRSRTAKPDQVADVDEAEAPDALLPGERIGELVCQGSNHVPGHTRACPMWDPNDDLDGLPF